MTVGSPTVDLSTATGAHTDFGDGLLRHCPEALSAETHALSLIALMDDGRLHMLASLGDPEQTPSHSSIWSDGDVRALAQGMRDSQGDNNVITADGRLLVAITVHSVLYGVIEWRGDLNVASPMAVRLQATAAELAPVVEAAIRQ